MTCARLEVVVSFAGLLDSRIPLLHELAQRVPSKNMHPFLCCATIVFLSSAQCCLWA